jgi:hypothetical protein
MTRTEIVAVALRIVALWFLLAVASMTAITAGHVMSVSGGSSGAVAMGVLVEMTLLAVSVLIWKFSVPLAKWILPETDPGVQVAPWGTQDLERVALRVLGLNLTAWGVCGIGYSVAYGVLAGGEDWVNKGVQAMGVAECVRNLILVVFGLGFFLGKDGLKKIFEGVRDGGMELPGEPPEDDPSEPRSER